MFNDSLSRTRHIKFSRMSKFYKLENQHAITILQKIGILPLATKKKLHLNMTFY